MNNTSAQYKSILSGRHSFEVKVNISGTDYGMDVLTSLASSRSAFGSGSPRPGLAPAGELAPAAPAPGYEPPDLSGLASTIARAIAEIADRPQPEQKIRVYLDGKQLSDAVTKYQRRSSRASGQ